MDAVFVLTLDIASDIGKHELAPVRTLHGENTVIGLLEPFDDHTDPFTLGIYVLIDRIVEIFTRKLTKSLRGKCQGDSLSLLDMVADLDVFKADKDFSAFVESIDNRCQYHAMIWKDQKYVLLMQEVGSKTFARTELDETILIDPKSQCSDRD